MIKKYKVSPGAELNRHPINLEMLLTKMNIGISEWDLINQYVNWDENMFQIYNVDPNNFNHTHADFLQCVHVDDKNKVQDSIDKAFKSGNLFKIEFRLISHPGRIRYIAIQGQVILDKQATPQQLTMISQDITQQRETEFALRASDERFELAVNSAGIGVWDYFLGEDKLVWSDNMFKLYNVKPANFHQCYENFEACVHPDDRSKVALNIEKVLKSGEIFKSLFRIITHKDGVHYILAHAKVSYDAFGKAVRLTGINQDITQQVRAEQQLEKQAKVDELTNVLSRVAIHELLDRIIINNRHHVRLAVFYLDVDNFKEINDKFGHEFGDLFLQKVAETLKTVTRDSDHVGRIAGDEFIIVTENLLMPEMARLLALRILKAFSKAVVIENTTLQISMSIGIAYSSPEVNNREILLRNADFAMYKAKQQGGSNYVFFDEKLNCLSDRLDTIEKGLDSSLLDENLKVLYQPVVDINNGRLEGIQTQLYWCDQHQSDVDYDELILIAEKASLTHAINQWLLVHSLEQYGQWRLEKPNIVDDVFICIRVSKQQADYHEFFVLLEKLMHQYQIKPENIVLQVSGSTLLYVSKKAPAAFDVIENLRIKVAVNGLFMDFLELERLDKKLPLDFMMVEPAALVRAAENENYHHVISAVMHLINELGVIVVATEVDSVTDINALRQQQINNAGGDFICKSLTASDFYKELFLKPQQCVDLTITSEY